MTILHNIVRFVGLVVGVPTPLPHLLNVQGIAALPQVNLPRPLGDMLVVVDAVNVTVTRGPAGPADVDVYVEHWHTYESALPPGGLAGLAPFVLKLAGTPPPVEDWVPGASMPDARQDFAFNLLTAGSIFVAGGEFNPGSIGFSTSVLFNLATNTWTPKAVIPNDGNQDPKTVQGITLPDGTFLFLPTIYAVATHAEVYTPGGDSWADTVGVKELSGSTLLANGLHDLYLIPSGPFAGCILLAVNDQNGNSNIYNPTAAPIGGILPGEFGGISAMVDSGETGGCCSCQSADGHVFVANKIGFSAHSFQEWDPATNVWTQRADLPYLINSGSRIIELTSGPEAGNILLVGGSAVLSTPPPYPAGFDTTLIWNRVGDTWAPGPIMGTNRYHPALERLSDGRIICVGGNANNGGVEFFDEATAAWTPGPPMPWNGQAMGASPIAAWNGNPAFLAIFGGVEDGVVSTRKVAIFRLTP